MFNKKGRDSRNSCTSCHSVTEICSGLSIPHPKPHPKNFSSVLSLFVPCHIRLSVYCPVATLGHSVFFIRSKVRIRLAFVRCQWSRSHAQHPVTVIRTTLSSL